jgi:hypothetical protein
MGTENDMRLNPVIFPYMQVSSITHNTCGDARWEAASQVVNRIPSYSVLEIRDEVSTRTV